MTVVADTTVEFPVTPSYGFVAAPYYETSGVRREGGFERINSKWSRPLIFLESVPVEDVPESEIQKLLYFYHALGGPGGYFRIRDWSDYRSADYGVAITSLDQPLVEIGSTGTFQLVREYTYGNLTRQREIVKPKGDTVVVANDSGVEQAEATFSLDEANGILTPDVSFSGTPTTWGGEYDIEARFDSNLDIDIVNFGTRNTRVSIVERRREQNT